MRYLWDLSLDDLKIEVKKQYEINKENAVDGDPDLEFLGEGKVDSKEVLKFEILKDIYVTKKTEKENYYPQGIFLWGFFFLS